MQLSLRIPTILFSPLGKRSGCTFGLVLDLTPLPHFAREGIDAQGEVFLFRFVWAIQEEMVGVGKGKG